LGNFGLRIPRRRREMAIVKFYPKDAAENPDNVLELAMGVYESVLILGYNEEGYLDPRVSLNLDVEEMLFLIEKFKFKLLAGDYDE
jgi:hypothetical protein